MSKQIQVSEHFTINEEDPFTPVCMTYNGDWKPITDLSSQFVESRLTKTEQKILAIYREWELPPTNGQIAEVVRQMKLWFKSPEYHTVLETYVKQVSEGFKPATESKKAPEEPPKEERKKIPITEHLWIYENDPSMLMITIDGRNVSARFTSNSHLYNYTTEEERKKLGQYRMALSNYEVDLQDKEKTIALILTAMPKLDGTGDVLPQLSHAKHTESIERAKHDREESENTMPVKANERKSMTVERGSSLALAQNLGMPEELADMFFKKIDGKPYIMNPGLLYLANRKGYKSIQVTDRYDEKTRLWIAETRVYPKISIQQIEAVSKLNPEIQKEALDMLTLPTIGIGTAGTINVQNNRMHPFLREMAQTRSQNRALRAYTGYGDTSAEEMPTATIEGETQ